MNGINLAQDKVKWLAVVNLVSELQVAWTAEQPSATEERL